MDELTKKRITARVKQAREEAGISQEEMASLLGLTHRAYQWYESQKDPRPPLRRLREIAEVTGRSQEWLLRGDPEPATDPSAQIRELSDRVESLEALIRERLPPQVVPEES